jgi:hypothetical protein
VQARGECVVKRKGKCFSATHPETVGPSIAFSAFSSTLQRAFERADVNQFLQLSIK